MNEREKKFQLWLHKKYATWLGEQPPGSNRSDFARYLNISTSMLSGFLGGSRVPARRTLYAMAYVLGSEIYEILDKKKPKSGIEEVARRWNEISEEVQLKVIELIRADQKR